MKPAFRPTSLLGGSSAGRVAVRTLAFASFMAFASISLQWYSPYIRPYTLSILGLVAALAGSALLCRVPRWQRQCDTWLSTVDSMSRRARFGWMAFGTVVPLLLCLFVLDPIPHIPDGYAYLFQATLFTQGRLWALAPAIPEAFPAPWSVTMDDRVFAVFPPGWPLALAPGVAIGAPWLVNPLLGGASLAAIHALLDRLADRRVANRGLVLCATSPFYLFMSASFMSHNASLLASTLFALGFLRVAGGNESRAKLWGSVSALGIGFQILVRPVSAAFIWFPWVAAFFLFRRRRESLRAIAWSIGGAIAGTLLYGAYNRQLVGEWGVPPLYHLAPENRYGFGDDIGIAWASSFPTPGHDLYRALLNLNFNTVVMNNDLFGWPMTSLLFVAVCLFAARLAWPQRLALAVVASFVVSYAGYWYNGVAFGARFYYCLLPYLALLTVAGAGFARDRIREIFPTISPEVSRSFVIGCVLAFSAYGALVYVPRVALTAPYWNQRKISDALYSELDARVRPGDLVLVETDSDERYNPAFIRNHFDIEDGEILYAWDRGEEANAALLARYPERRVVRWRYPIERLPEQEAHTQLRRMWQGD